MNLGKRKQKYILLRRFFHLIGIPPVKGCEPVFGINQTQILVNPGYIVFSLQGSPGLMGIGNGNPVKHSCKMESVPHSVHHRFAALACFVKGKRRKILLPVYRHIGKSHGRRVLHRLLPCLLHGNSRGLNIRFACAKGKIAVFLVVIYTEKNILPVVPEIIVKAYKVVFSVHCHPACEVVFRPVLRIPDISDLCRNLPDGNLLRSIFLKSFPFCNQIIVGFPLFISRNQRLFTGCLQLRFLLPVQLDSLLNFTGGPAVGRPHCFHIPLPERFPLKQYLAYPVIILLIKNASGHLIALKALALGNHHQSVRLYAHLFAPAFPVKTLRRLYLVRNGSPTGCLFFSFRLQGFPPVSGFLLLFGQYNFLLRLGAVLTACCQQR